MTYITPTTYVLITLITTILIFIWRRAPKSKLIEPPSPFALPIIGHLHLLGGYEVPYQAFTDLGKKYGNLVKLKLGSVDALVVNGTSLIRNVLVTKGNLFDSRPNFERYRQLFSGDKSNSLAFCDWSDKQKMRRDMLRSYTFPRASTHRYFSLDDIISENTSKFVKEIKTGAPIAIKKQLLKTCANIFTQHFCSKDFSLVPSSTFEEMIENFDEIFYEVNQGYAADFLPFLLPLHRSNLRRMNALTHEIRNFINKEIISDRFEDFKGGDSIDDYVDSLIKNAKGEEEGAMTWDTALFALEDIIGGHSAVGNFVMKMLGYLVKEPQVIKKIQMEIDKCTKSGDGYRPVSVTDRNSMPYTEAAVLEAVRLIASPIVPRVANQDTTVDGYLVKKDTVLFLNNYELSMSEELWNNPNSFDPQRFIVEGNLIKPAHFLPFGGGKRGCMGYRMVQLTSFGILGALLQNFDLLPVSEETYKVPVGSLALPKDTFKFLFENRLR